MIVLALLIAILPPLSLGQAWLKWIYQVLVILVIVYPCALVISTPISIVSSLAKAAINGILIKGGEFIEIPATLKAIALMTDNISKLAWLIKHSKKTLMIIKQNIKLCYSHKSYFYIFSYA